MPIEIREMIIRADVRENCGPHQNGAAQNSQSRSGGNDREAIVQEAVDRVMDILKRKAAH